MPKPPDIWLIARYAPRRSLLWSLAGTLLTLMTLVASPSTAFARAPHSQTSSNWGGYAVTAAKRFNGVLGSWVQPTATCDQSPPAWAAFWVGIGGFRRASKALEQIGTEADCTAGGRPRAYAWYELVPAPPVRLALKVSPGDQLAARVTVNGKRVLLRIRNLTTGRSFSKTVRMRTADTTSAEWIAEAPSECGSGQCVPLPLTNFGSIKFGGATATTADGHAGAIDDPLFTATKLTLSSSGPALGPTTQSATSAGASSLATPSDLSPDGGTFSVSVTPSPAPQAPAPPPLAGPDQLQHAPNSAGAERALAGSVSLTSILAPARLRPVDLTRIGSVGLRARSCPQD